MPGLLIDAVPFGAGRDAELERLLQVLRASLEPDGLELLFFFPDTGRSYRRRFAGSGADTGIRPVPAWRNEPGTEEEGVLTVPFGSPGELEGALLLRRRRARPWTAAERTRFQLVKPFVATCLAAVGEAQVCRAARRRLLAIVEEMEPPALVFDQSGTILFANDAADRLMSAQTEQGLAVLSGSRRGTPLVSHLIQIAWAEPPAGRERIALSDGRSLEARVVAIPEEPGTGEPPARLVLLKEREALTIDDVRPHLLARGVSGREADVVSGVLRGLRNAEIARELFISEYTVKDHLKHVFSKLGVESRGSLLHALHAGAEPPPRAATAPSR